MHEQTRGFLAPMLTLIDVIHWTRTDFQTFNLSKHGLLPFQIFYIFIVTVEFLYNGHPGAIVGSVYGLMYSQDKKSWLMLL